MPDIFDTRPGLWFVVATLLPLLSFLVILISFGVRTFVRKEGIVPSRVPAYVATGAMALSFFCCLTGFLIYHHESHDNEHKVHDLHHKIAHLKDEQSHLRKPKAPEKKDEETQKKFEAALAEFTKKSAELQTGLTEKEKELHTIEARWAGHINWAQVSPTGLKDSQRGTILQLGYYIDNLSVTMFLMVTFIATLIHLFSIGYMGDEAQPEVADHEVHTDHGHLHRRGRFGRFFLFLSLFCFSMLNLILADNLFQVFVSWELVGICSYLLISFYFERTSASNAANKAFITNRIGDAGFILGLMIVWSYIGTFNFQEIFQRVRCPVFDSHPEHALPWAGQIVRAKENEPSDRPGVRYLEINQTASATLDTRAVLYHRVEPGHWHGDSDHIVVYDDPSPYHFGHMPYWLLVAAGLGIFLGCVGKSAQFPLQVWLPDAMEGPTPVSALIHAATMVAAGVYLVGRCYPLFTPEVTLTIAYTGAITLFVAATVALVMTDIKKVLAYSTVSQLGYMMLALGVGGWVAGLFHLITHAFFKALLFLGSGSVIYGCHHQQDMLKMGGLYPKMKITALTMLAGVLAIAGVPLFSGWYSKDAILAQALGFSLVHNEHFLLFLLPLVTAGITTFYMFRMWFMTFTGPPKDEHVYEHAHESPWVMTVPLIALAFFSVVVAWPLPSSDHGWPLLNAEASGLEHWMHHSQPTSVIADFGHVVEHDGLTDIPTKPREVNERLLAHENHHLAGFLALGIVILGFAFAVILYYWRVLDPAEAKEQFPAVHRFLVHKWYFDELYSALLVRPALAVAGWFRWVDTNVIDRTIDNTARSTVKTSFASGWWDLKIVDGLVNLTARVMWAVGSWLRNIQTGYLRSYVLFLVLAAIGIWIVLAYLIGVPPAAGGP